MSHPTWEELKAFQDHLYGLETTINALHEKGAIDKASFQGLDILEDIFNDLLAEMPLPDSEHLITWIDLSRAASWDISSLLTHDCDGGGFQTDEMYGPDRYADDANSDWPAIISHYASKHNLNLLDERINWSFDT